MATAQADLTAGPGAHGDPTEQRDAQGRRSGCGDPTRQVPQWRRGVRPVPPWAGRRDHDRPGPQTSRSSPQAADRAPALPAGCGASCRLRHTLTTDQATCQVSASRHPDLGYTARTVPIAVIAFDFDPLLRLSDDLVVRWQTLALAAVIAACLVVAGRRGPP